MQAKHTPGPWNVDIVVRPDWDSDPLGQYEVQPAAEKLTVRYWDAADESPELDAVHAENQANARLIAAAPELLQALTEIVAEWDRTCEEYTAEHPMCFLRDTAGMLWARDAIAKAEGSEKC
jgi:hypothetical protein